MTSGSTLSAIIPVHNEVELVERQLYRIDTFLGDHVADHELILVESGSTDGTGEVCDRLSRELARVRTIHEDARNGYGAAVRLGFKAATNDLLICIPADLPFPLETFNRALPLIESADCVIGYRSEDDRSPFRRAQSRIFNAMSKAVLDLPMRTVNSAFKLYRKRMIDSFELRSNGWLIEAEILYWVARGGFVYNEIPITVPEREAGRSKVGILDPFRMLHGLLALRRTLSDSAVARASRIDQTR